MFSRTHPYYGYSKITTEDFLVACDWVNSNGKEYTSDTIVYFPFTTCELDDLMAERIPHFRLKSNKESIICFRSDLANDLLAFVGINSEETHIDSMEEDFNDFYLIDPRMKV